MNGEGRRSVPAERLSASWVVDAAGILAIDALGEEAHWLHGSEAAVWSWLTAGHSRAEVARFLAASLSIDTDEAGQRLDVMLCAWREAGLLQTGAASGG